MTLTFDAPSTPTILTLTLVVTDALGFPSVPDTVVITITEHYTYIPVVMRSG